MNELVIHIFKAWQKIIDESEEFTPEIEELGDRIAWYCVRHNISIEEYNKAIYG